MKTWSHRPIEEANLLNPAFSCVTLNASVIGYISVDTQGMPFVLAFVILPLILHKPTRENLPPNTRTSLAAWLLNNSTAKILFPERVISLKPYTREAILFGLTHDWLSMNTDARVKTNLTETTLQRHLRELNGEARDCVMRARFVGRWLASAGSTQTIMNLWGIRP